MRNGRMGRDLPIKAGLEKNVKNGIIAGQTDVIKRQGAKPCLL
jgi:hypothetical protein